MKRTTNCTVSHSLWLTCLILLSLIPLSGHAQTITWAFVNAAGFDEGPDCRLAWTMGEPMTTETSGEQGTLRMGFIPFAAEGETTATMRIDPAIVITLSPNPAADWITIHVPTDEQYLVRILSIDGRSGIASDITHEVTLDIRTLPAGTYVLYILDTDGDYNSTLFIKS